MSELEAYWLELEEGKYDWAQVAMLYWPTRVTDKCRRDKSLAIAHGLDEEYFPGLREELRREATVPDQPGVQKPDGQTEDLDYDE